MSDLGKSICDMCGSGNRYKGEAGLLFCKECDNWLAPECFPDRPIPAKAKWDETAPSREYVLILRSEITRLRTALADERKRALEAQSDLEQLQIAAAIRALKEPTK